MIDKGTPSGLKMRHSANRDSSSLNRDSIIRHSANRDSSSLNRDSIIRHSANRDSSSLSRDSIIRHSANKAAATPLRSTRQPEFELGRTGKVKMGSKHDHHVGGRGGDDDASHLQKRSRYLLARMKLELSLIDAYSTTQGWKRCREKQIRPEKELQRAERQIVKCKLGLRDIIRQLDSLASEGRIADSVMFPDGSVFHEHIFCARCNLRDAWTDNDIILCDGTCNRAFHQKCLVPPLPTDHIPPGDQGWLCSCCECKLGIFEAMNAHLGTAYSVSCTPWKEIFKEAEPDGGDVAEWPSDNSADVNYEPSDDSGESAGTAEDQTAGGGGRRRARTSVDYVKMYGEMFTRDGAFVESSEDGDWMPETERKPQCRPGHDDDGVRERRTIEAEREMERWCVLKMKVTRLRQSLLKPPTGRSGVMYVPTRVVVKEKLTRPLCQDPNTMM